MLLMKPILFALLLAAAQPTYAQISSAPIPVDPQLTHGTLANGLQYYILRNQRPASKAELRLVVQAGSLNEADDQRGLAHLIEHMAFNGTKNFPKQTLVDQLERMGIKFGADLNAYTSFDETVYILPVPINTPDDLKTGLQVLEDWAFHMNLDDAQIEQERGILVEEWRMSTQNPSAQIFEKNIALALKDSRYPQRLPIGQMDVVRHTPAQRLRDFYHDWYRPNLMSVIVVGDVDVAQTRAMIEQKFGDEVNPANPPAAPSKLIPNNIEPIIGVFTDPNLPQNSVMLLQKDAADNPLEVSVNDYVTKLKHILITLMLDERLNALKDSAQPPFIAADTMDGALFTTARSKRAYMAAASAASGSEAEALRALHLEHQRVIDHGFTQAELDRASNNLLANTTNYYNNRDKVESADKAAEYIRGAVENEALPSAAWEYATTQKYVPTFKLNDINQLAKSYFTDANRIVLINSSQKPDLDDAKILAIINSKPTTTNTQSTETGALLKTKPMAGKIINSSFDKKLNLTTWQLSNGVTVQFKKTDFNNDQISFASYADGGSSQIPDDVWRKTQWAYNGLSETGINGYNKTQLSQLLAGRLVNVKPVMNEDSQGFAGQFAPKDTETALQLIYSQITGMNHDAAAFGRYVQRGIGSTQNLENDRMSAFSDYVARQINRNNPRFTGAYPNADAWKTIDYEAAYQTHQQLLKNANGMQFTFVGKIDEKPFKTWVETYLASLPSDLSSKPQYKDTGYRPDINGRRVEFKKGKENLSVVYIGINGQAQYDAKEALALQAAGEILTIKLTEHLREAEGGVYSINASGEMHSRPYGEYNFTIEFPCAPDKADQLVQSAQQQLDDLIHNGPSATDVEKFKKTAQVQLREQLKTNEFWVNSLQKSAKRGKNPQDILNQETRLLDLSAADIQAVAQKYLAVKAGVAILRTE